jgi:hypothetical protein
MHRKLSFGRAGSLDPVCLWVYPDGYCCALHELWKRPGRMYAAVLEVVTGDW